MSDNLYKFLIPYGELIIYGDNLNICKPYTDNVGLESVEVLCFYCQRHNLHIYYNPQRKLREYLNIPCLRSLTKQYSVHSTWNDVLRYVNAQS